MKKLFLFIATCLLAINVQAQLFFKNTTTEPLTVAVVMHYEAVDFNGWISQGWFRIDPGELRAITRNVSGSFVYYFVQTNDNRMSANGVRPFLVDPINGFTIKNADMDYNKRERPNLIWQKFLEAKVPMGSKLSSKFTIQL